MAGESPPNANAAVCVPALPLFNLLAVPKLFPSVQLVPSYSSDKTCFVVPIAPPNAKPDSEVPAPPKFSLAVLKLFPSAHAEPLYDSDALVSTGLPDPRCPPKTNPVVSADAFAPP